METQLKCLANVTLARITSLALGLLECNFPKSNKEQDRAANVSLRSDIAASRRNGEILHGG